jgi:hypothetical protein
MRSMRCQRKVVLARVTAAPATEGSSAAVPVSHSDSNKKALQQLKESTVNRE